MSTTITPADIRAIMINVDEPAPRKVTLVKKTHQDAKDSTRCHGNLCACGNVVVTLNDGTQARCPAKIVAKMYKPNPDPNYPADPSVPGEGPACETPVDEKTKRWKFCNGNLIPRSPCKDGTPTENNARLVLWYKLPEGTIINASKTTVDFMGKCSDKTQCEEDPGRCP